MISVRRQIRGAGAGGVRQAAEIRIWQRSNESRNENVFWRTTSSLLGNSPRSKTTWFSRSRARRRRPQSQTLNENSPSLASAVRVVMENATRCDTSMTVETDSGAIPMTTAEIQRRHRQNWNGLPKWCTDLYWQCKKIIITIPLICDLGCLLFDSRLIVD